MDLVSNLTLLGRMRLCSEAIEDYMARETYINDAVCPEAVTEGFIIQKCLDILLGELDTLGLQLNVPMEMIVDNQEAVDILVVMRKLLSAQSLYSVFTKCTTEIIRQYEQLISRYADDVNYGSLFEDFIELVRTHILFNDEWKIASVNSSVLYSNEKFYEHIKAIYDRVTSAGSPPVFNEVNFQDVMSYLDYRETHRGYYLEVIRMFMTANAGLNRVVFLNEYEIHDLDLTSHQDVGILAKMYLKVEMTPVEEKIGNDIMTNHRKKNLHHPEHYVYLNQIPSVEQHGMMIADDIEGIYTKEQVDKVINELVEKGKGLVNKNILLDLAKNIKLTGQA